MPSQPSTVRRAARVLAQENRTDGEMAEANSSQSAAAAPRADCGRTALRRILRIHELLSHGHPMTSVSLGRELEVSERTIKRDVEFMRDQLGAPIDWDNARRSYVYSRPCDILPLLRLEAGEALALALAGQTFAAWHGSSLGQALTAAVEKIAGVVGGAVSVPLSEIASLVLPPTGGPVATDELRHFPAVLEAIRRRRELRIVYQKPRPGAVPESRLVHPLHLACLDHRWVLIAYDPARGAPRNFLLGRIQQATSTASTFSRPAGFDLAAYVRGSLGRFTGAAEHEVRLRFDSELAPYLRERPWHASQTITNLPDGAIEVSLRLNNLTDVRRHILACGRHVEVLAPTELRAAIAAEAAALAERHGQEKD